MERLFELLKKLIADKFYGSLEIHFESGKVTYMKKTQTIKVT